MTSHRPETAADRLLRAATESLLEAHSLGAPDGRLDLEIDALVSALEPGGADALLPLLRNLIERLVLADAALADLGIDLDDEDRPDGARLIRAVLSGGRRFGLRAAALGQVEALLRPGLDGRSGWERLLRAANDGPDASAFALLPSDLGLSPAVLQHLAGAWPAEHEGVRDPSLDRPWVLPPVRPEGGTLHGAPQAVLSAGAARVGDRYVLRLNAGRDRAALHPLVLREVEGASDVVFPSPGRPWSALGVFRESVGSYEIPLRLRPPAGRHRYIVILVPKEQTLPGTTSLPVAGVREAVEAGRLGAEDFVVDVVDPRRSHRPPPRRVADAGRLGLVHRPDGDWTSVLGVPGQATTRSLFSPRGVQHAVARTGALLELLNVKTECGTDTPEARVQVEAELGAVLGGFFCGNPGQADAWRSLLEGPGAGVVRLLWVEGIDRDLRSLPWEVLPAAAVPDPARSGSIEVVRGAPGPGAWTGPLGGRPSVRRWSGDGRVDAGAAGAVLVAPVDGHRECAALLAAVCGGAGRPAVVVIDVASDRLPAATLLDLAERIVASGVPACAVPLRGCSRASGERMLHELTAGLGAGRSIVAALCAARAAIGGYEFALVLGTGEGTGGVQQEAPSGGPADGRGDP